MLCSESESPLPLGPWRLWRISPRGGTLGSSLSRLWTPFGKFLAEISPEKKCVKLNRTRLAQSWRICSVAKKKCNWKKYSSGVPGWTGGKLTGVEVRIRELLGNAGWGNHGFGIGPGWTRNGRVGGAGSNWQNVGAFEKKRRVGHCSWGFSEHRTRHSMPPSIKSSVSVNGKWLFPIQSAFLGENNNKHRRAIF